MLKKKLVFNPEGNDSLETREILGGNSTGIANLNSVKYNWTSKLYQIMLNNHWIPQKVSLVDDRTTIKELTLDEMDAFKSTLSFLIALDSMQTANIPYLSAYITAPEVCAVFTLQQFQEQIHSQSYQYLLQELFPSVEREEIYNYWRTNQVLLERNKKIAAKYQDFVDSPTKENFKKALSADFVLEGIYFYNGFQFFYQLASRGKVSECAKMIKYIENDEQTHVTFMKYLIQEELDVKNNAGDREILENAIKDGVESEIAWSNSTYGDRILGMSNKSSEEYSKYLGNKLSKLVGLGTLYRGFSENPYAYLESDKREGFFETTVTEYAQSSAVSGWDDF